MARWDAASSTSSLTMPAFDSDFVVGSLSRLQAKVLEMPLLFAAFATMLYWTVISYYRGQTRKVITMAYLFGTAA